MATEEIEHIPVLLEEIMDYAEKLLKGKEKPFIIDATLGEAGHSLAFRKRFPDAVVVSNDRDEAMIARARGRIEAAGVEFVELDAGSEMPEPGQIGVFTGPFGRLAVKVGAWGRRPDFILADLGVSLFHFRGAERGFSYNDESLDMRLDPGLPLTAREIVNRWSEPDLKKIFKELGEERYSGRVAGAIVANRPIETAKELAVIVKESLPSKFVNARNRSAASSIHPATRVFQALRMSVNQELSELQQALEEFPDLLHPGGALAVISFHSLEDRLVKNRFRDLGDKQKFQGEDVPEYKKKKILSRKDFWILTPRPVVPSDGEVDGNAASRSSKLRVLQKKADTKIGYEELDS